MSRKQVEKKAISQEWLTTYADMVTLILTFFVLLYSFSLVDANKFRAATSSIAGALSGNGGSPGIFDYNSKTGDVPIVGEDLPGKDINSAPKASQGGDSMYESVNEFISENQLGELVSIKQSQRGVIIEFKDKILFESGRAEIKDDGVPVLMKTAELLRKLPNNIVIEGHTDNVPIHTAQFPSNWELSTARAMRVLWYMTENRGLSPKKFSMAAYGEYSPIASNDTPEGRAQNRRVNILILTTPEKLDKNSPAEK